MNRLSRSPAHRLARPAAARAAVGTRPATMNKEKGDGMECSNVRTNSHLAGPWPDVRRAGIVSVFEVISLTHFWTQIESITHSKNCHAKPLHPTCAPRAPLTAWPAQDRAGHAHHGKRTAEAHAETRRLAASGIIGPVMTSRRKRLSSASSSPFSLMSSGSSMARGKAAVRASTRSHPSACFDVAMSPRCG
jgi:hypothetical protein